MATTYEVRIPVVDKGHTEPPLVDQLAHGVAAGLRCEVEHQPDSPHGRDALVHVWVDAAAQLAGLDAVRAALDSAGLREPAVGIGDPDVRSGH